MGKGHNCDNCKGRDKLNLETAIPPKAKAMGILAGFI